MSKKHISRKSFFEKLAGIERNAPDTPGNPETKKDVLFEKYARKTLGTRYYDPSGHETPPGR